MPRMLKRDLQSPYGLALGGEGKHGCHGHLSKNHAFLAGSHALTGRPAADLLDCYDNAGQAHVCADNLGEIRDVQL